MAVAPIVISPIIGLAVAAFTFWFVQRLKNDGRPPLPPGPKGLPLLGNIRDLPAKGEYEPHHWLKHKELYGPITSVSAFGQTIIVVHEADLAIELLEKRSAIHSSRPRQVFAGEMVGWENAAGLCPYNERFRIYRKKLSRVMGSPKAVSEFSGLQEAEVGHFLLHLLDKPERLVDHIRQEAGAVVLKIAYGYTVEPHKSDPLVEMALDAMDKFGVAAVPGAFLVDLLPFLRHLPDWFPGAGFKKLSREWRKGLMDTTDKPYDLVKNQMAAGKHRPSMLSRLLEEGDETPTEQSTSKWSAMILYTAGADTTVASITAFFLAMMMHPETQRKAQEEIDQLTGGTQLPMMADRDRLPYVNALVKEVLRWHPVAPMILPHTSTADDVFHEYFIPKDAIILVNVWNITHDPEKYRDPMAFRPERFLGPDPDEDPGRYVFGFGRRVCPGRLLAEAAVFLTVAQTLAVMDISSPPGAPEPPTLVPEPGVVSRPAAFEARVEPRSDAHERLIRDLERKYPWQESDAEALMAGVKC